MDWPTASDVMMAHCPVATAMLRAEALAATSKRVRISGMPNQPGQAEDPAVIAKRLCDAELLASEFGSANWAPAMRTLSGLADDWASRSRGRSTQQLKRGALPDAEAYAVDAVRSEMNLSHDELLPVSVLASASMGRAVLSQLAVSDLRVILKRRLVPQEGARARVGLKLLTDGQLPILRGQRVATALEALIPDQVPVAPGLVEMARNAPQDNDLLALQVLANACRGGWRVWHSDNPSPQILTSLSSMRTLSHLGSVSEALDIASLRTAMHQVLRVRDAGCRGIDTWPPQGQRYDQNINVAATELHAQHTRVRIAAELSKFERS
jgi:hypothetical protein